MLMVANGFVLFAASHEIMMIVVLKMKETARTAPHPNADDFAATIMEPPLAVPFVPRHRER